MKPEKINLLFTRHVLWGYTWGIMNKDRTEHFRAILNGKMEELLGQADKAVSGMSGSNEENFPDPSDRASLETDRNFLLRVKDRERKLISKIKEALKRIEDGTYGVCELCGEDISVKRLEARPVTTCCIECKKEEEEQEKSRS
jgi:DnaK suppressor protein